MKLNVVFLVFFIALFLAGSVSATDPQDYSVSWVKTYDNSSQTDYGSGVVIDSSKNIIVTGLSKNTTYDYTTIKYDQAGNLIWTAVYNSGFNDTGRDVVVDSQNNVIVTGTNLIGSGGGDISNRNYTTIKYDANGNQIWAQIHSASSIPFLGGKVAVDSQDNIIVSRDYELTKYGPNGNILWDKVCYIPQWGQYFTIVGMTADKDNNIVVTGRIQLNNGQYYYYATAKYSGLNGDLLWNVYDPATQSNSGSGTGWAVAVDSENNIITAGGSGNAGGLTNKYYAIKYDSNGNVLWTYLGNTGQLNNIMVDSQDNIFVTAYTNYAFNIIKLAEDDGSYSTAIINYGTALSLADTGMDINDNIFITGAIVNSASSDYFLVKLTKPATPIADAGPDQTANLGSIVTLNGSGSSDPNGDLPLTYNWTIISKPAASVAVISNSDGVTPSFTADEVGDYFIQLVVTDSTGLSSLADTVTVKSIIPTLKNAVTVVVNQFDDKASIIDEISGTPTIRGSVYVGDQPVSVAVTPDGKKALVTSLMDGSVTVIDLTTSVPAVSSLIDFGNVRARGVAVSPDGNRAYVTYNTIDSQINHFVTLDLTGTTPQIINDLVLSTYPTDAYDIGITNDGKYALIVMGYSGLVTVVDLTTNTEVYSINLGNQYPVSIGMDPTGKVAVVTNIGTNSVSIIDLTLSPFAFKSNVLVGINPGSVPDISPDGRYAVVANSDSDSVSIIDLTLTTPAVIKTINVGDDPRGVQIINSSNVALVANRNSNTITKIDLNTLSVIGTFYAGYSPKVISVIESEQSNNRPIANAGSDQTLSVSSIVNLDASGSYDPDGDPITYKWEFLSKPAGSTANLVNALTANPSFQVNLPGDYEIKLVVTDQWGVYSLSDTITVKGVSPPVLDYIGPKTVDEGGSLSFSVSGSDLDSGVLIYSASGLPDGATFDGTTFSWTPGYDHAGSYSVNFQVSDGASTDSETVPITVTNVNRAPLLGAIGAQSVYENQNLAFTVSGSDADDDQVTYSAIGLPSNAALNSETGAFSWAPTYEQAGTYEMTFTVTDEEGATDTEMVIILVSNVNRPPVLNPISNQAVNEGGSLFFTVSGSDADGDLLTYSATGLPSGATLDSVTGAFSWTPNFTQAGNYPVTFTITDTLDGSYSETVWFTVNNVNRPPLFNSIGNQEVNEGQSISFTLLASDPDGDQVTYTATGLPVGATLDGTTFSWTPGYDQAGSYSVTFQVSDGVLTDSETVTITVTNVNRAPILGAIGAQSVDENQNLEFTVSGSDLDGDALTYSSSPLPDGATLNPQTGAFQWIPTYEQAGTYEVTFTVTDEGGATDTEMVIFTVNNINRPPVVGTINAITVSEQQAINFQVPGSDADADALTYSPVGIWPEGAQISSTGLLTWIPSYAQSGEYTPNFLVTDGINTNTGLIPITVTNVNQAPVFELIGARSIDENQNLAFTLAGSDADGDILTYSATGLPSSATLNSASGSFTWTPDFAQAGIYPVTFTVSDNSGGTNSEIVIITVNNVNRPPVLNEIENQEVNGGQSLSFTVSGNDPDGDSVIYTATDLPVGATFVGDTFNCDSATPGIYTVTFTATAGGQSDSKTMTINVIQNANQAPVAILDGPYTAYEGSEITFDGSASSDPDGDTLTYEWDLDGDGTFETLGMMVSRTWPDDYTGTVSLRVTDSKGLTSVASSTVTVTNTAPSATLSSSFLVKVPITMRVAGQPGNSVELQIIQEGVVILSKTILFTAGSPNEQEVSMVANIDMSKPYTSRLLFSTGTKTSGATPVWLIIDGKKTKVATFKSNPNNPSTWSQTLNIPLKGLFTLANKEITFNAQAIDSGADAITFEWSFGDGTDPEVNTYTSDGTTVINDSVAHTYLLPGVYQLILTVRDDEGAEVSYQMEVRVV